MFHRRLTIFLILGHCRFCRKLVSADVGQYVILSAPKGTVHNQGDVTRRLKEKARADRPLQMDGNAGLGTAKAAGSRAIGRADARPVSCRKQGTPLWRR
jgi:hypothetical protein